MATLICEKFYVLPWDISNRDTHPVLIKAVRKHFDLSLMSSYIIKKISSLFVISSTLNKPKVIMCVTDKDSKKSTIYNCLIDVKAKIEQQCQLQEELSEIEENRGYTDDME